MKKIILLLGISCRIFGQEDTLSQKSIQFSAYAEGYYLIDPVDKLNHERASFFFNHAQANQLDLNLGILGISWLKGPFYAQFSGMIGTYARRNLANEPGFWKNVYEWNVSYKPQVDWTIMAGVFPSHIGFESAKNADNWTLSRSFVAENSPYYESGISVYFKPNKSWTFGILGLRGWQHIYDLSPAIGTQMTYVSGNSWTWNSSGFIGNEGRGSRLFHDFYLIVPLSKKLRAVLISDIGYEKEFWHGEALMIQAKLSDKWKMAGRIEQFSDRKAIILPPDSFVQSASVNADFSLFPKMLFRAEWKVYHSSNETSNIHSPEYIFGVVFGK